MKNSTRRSFINKSVAALGLSALPASAFSFNIIRNLLPKGDIIGHGDFKYRVNKEWGIQDPAKIPVNDCHEMVQDKRGRLFLLTNQVKNNMIIYDRSGKVTGTWTVDFPGAHGLTLAEEGDEEFLFITDTDIHKVVKTTLDGKVLLELDYPQMVDAYQEAGQWKPTETTVAPNGEFYVADGYGQNVIVRYSAKGEYIGHFGGKGQGDSQFDCCHGITLDTRDGKNDTLLITSRSANQFKRFSLEGQHLETIDLPGCWICRPVIKDDVLYFAVIVTKTWDSYDGMVAVLDSDNKIVSLPGATNPPDYASGKLSAPDSDLQTFLNPHDVCIDNDLNIYVPQWNSENTYPVMLERV